MSVVYYVDGSMFLRKCTDFNALLEKQWEEVDERRKSSDLSVQWDNYEAADEADMHRWLLAERGDKVLGFISMFLCPSMHTGELTALTDTMYVLPEERGTGVGTELIKRAEEMVKEMGAKHMMVTFKNDVDHAPLAERLGLFNYETVYCKPL